MKREYGQFCGLAAGLDIVGERWTLLIVRELLIGPARFNALLENLPGIGPNLLTDRLRMLTEHGLAEQAAVVGDGRARLYRLTEAGEELRGPVLALARWGLRFLDESDSTGATRAEWGFLAVQAMIVENEVPDLDEVYEFKVGEQIFQILVRGGVVTFERGPVAEPALTIECEAGTFIRVGAKTLSPFEAIATGDVRIKGEPEAVLRCSRMLGLT
ncbi:crotonobetainyl-CoA--carnitine CoA-transferase [Streptomyces clavuligerus]|uniref:HxlR family transcriptional regulator n=1 Tax=Streptomyces clavuligerus TaxID=1901 RepID=D5SLD2_STRCL|nr:crotonobetainyl-CoA--carnitine CoA-transferase [Streptomyces clavuligerus]ANW22591.1 crotonobetainyl-CoA--carnitine CoA-transferase [Streptomyces clavuligerus]AXU16939.1 crotonobetainyl-CoA--carnitine CoA-transferase [Streptomyces clavuligerus]EFG04725.1 HxlR family transcriptional regulator [Streptomyces clavuligerus]MBY6306829.1 crotonobetainyl-CoA--carnitine CoA-transferase [Streptomyces clavuligerus]QCS10572.1 crotonobetainyl-CoA--carnitine CoA-transferase [Streptomyces clavuligerus]